VGVFENPGGNGEFVQQNTQKVTEKKKKKKTLEPAQAKPGGYLKEKGYKLFVIKQLNMANLKENEQQELENEYEKLSNIEQIKEVFAKTINLSDNEISGILQN